MNPEMNDSQLRDFAKQSAVESKKIIRTLFKEFKESSFPDAKKDALDYNTVCEIEDEFRKQEEATLLVVDEYFNEFITQSDIWLEQYKSTINRYVRIISSIAESFLTAIRGHHFTYWSCFPEHLTFEDIKLLERGTYEHQIMLNKQKVKQKRLSVVFQKKSTKMFAEKKAIEHSYQSKIDALIEVVLPASHKQIENLINQNYLQRVGAIHGLN